jgi:UDP-glucose 4-epimerase
VQVYGTDYPTPDGTAIRDYIHVLDLAEAHLRALDFLRKEDRSDIFNLGTGRGASVKEVLTTARRVSGVDIPTEYVARRPGDPIAVYADNTKAKAALAWNAALRARRDHRDRLALALHAPRRLRLSERIP